MDTMDWRTLFLDWNGRISRQTFWVGLIVLMVTNFLNFVLLGNGLLGYLAEIGIAFCAICVCVKRCHDRGKSGWWCLLFVIPPVGAIWALVDLGILEGVVGRNEYGPDPIRQA